MKYLKSPPRIIAVLAAAVFSAQLQAATPIWNAASGGNWSASGSWNPTVIPQPADDVQFGNVGAGNQNTMDAAFTIDSLIFAQDNGLTHTTLLNPGLTLTINRTTTGDVLNVGSGTAATGGNTLVPVAVQGPGSTLSLSGAGDMVIRQGNGTAGSHMATLDLSALDTFNANVGRLLVGQANAGAAVNRPSGTLLLAKTNTITLTSATAPQVMVQDSGSNANGGTASVLSLGQMNFFNVDQFRLGGQKGNGTVNFNATFSTPSLVIRNTDGLSRSTFMTVGDNSFATSGNSTVALVDLAAGSVDALVGTVVVAKGNPGPGTGTCAGTLNWSAGTIDVNTMQVGLQISTGINGAANGTLNLGNNGIVTTNNSLVSTGAVLRVNNTLFIAQTNTGGTGAVVGTLNVSGATIIASNIVAGGGNSTILLSPGSSLIISNSAGTLANPIRNFGIQDSSLTLPALNAGAVLAVSNLLTGGSQNIINISAVPPIGSYPATFSLITYRSGGGGNYVLGSLPSGGYAGSIIDLGNGVIQLKLTSGPLVDLSILWTAAQNNSWDTTTFNWNYKGTPSNFFAGATPVFDDTSAQPQVYLVTSISSGSVTVNNNAADYNFTGPGNIAGASSLIKTGSKALVIDNVGVDNFGSVAVNAGTLQIGSGDVDGEISTLNIADNGALVVNRSGTISMDSAITGTGSVSTVGPGTLVLSGSSSYSGPTMVSAGNLQVDGTLSGVGAVTTASGALLSGHGTVAGPVTVTGSVNPGTVNAPGTLTASGNFTLASGGTANFDLSGPNFSDSLQNDAIVVGGNLTLNNNTVNANFLGVPTVGAQYPLITYAGSLSGSFNPTVTGSHFTMALDTTSAPGNVYLNVTGGSGANLKWVGFDQSWDSVALNWTDLNSSAQSQFFSGDTVLFDDSSSTANISILSTVYPAAVTNISDTVNYTFGGVGKISGTGGIVKGGASLLTINTANDFSGTVDIQGGILKAGNNTALGSAAAGTTVETNATLDVGGQSLGGEIVTIMGNGFTNIGAVINSGGAVNSAIRQLVLAGDASVGGNGGTWALNNSGGTASLLTGNQPFKLTKVGTSQFGLQNLSTVDPQLGDIEIKQGTLEFNGLTSSMGDPAYTNYVDAGATLQFSSDTVVWNKFFDFTGDGVAASVNNGTSANTELAGAIALHGNVIINSGGTALTLSGPISGTGSLTKIGSTAMVLTNNETYTGDTHINVGAMRLAGTATISNTPNILIAQGATLTVTGRVDATFTLFNGQSLTGNGTIAGSLVTSPGSSIAPGTNTVGILTVSNTITLGGTTFMDLDQNNKTNDILFCNNGITYGGTLNLTAVTGALTNGASFKLFKAASYTGTFASIVPATPGNGLAWNTATLSTGVISVIPGTVTGPTTNATITSVKASGTNLLIHGVNNNVPNTSFHFTALTSTNLSLPLSNWTAGVTLPFNSDGTFDYTNPIVNTTPRQFIIIKAVP